ncbi:MAG: hypothetical protein HYZ63_02725 [Candidatus Andersenbacteria bacterium]|nr:hypothetical protein [Candidatus Andersenbacteria bacterium]
MNESGWNSSSLWLTRLAIFLVYVWFGILKVVYVSPANPLVESLMNKTLPFLTFNQFIVGFGLFEVLIGILFIIPRVEKVALSLLVIHLVTTVMPLFLLPAITWQAAFVPTLEGQYIIKNILIVACAWAVAGATLGRRRRSFFG